MAQSLVEAYGSVPAAERRAAYVPCVLFRWQVLLTGLANCNGRLEALVRDLGPQERRAVQTILSELQDPMAVLPLELILCIFGYLDLNDTWRLRSVCRRWNSGLCREALENDALTRFQSHQPSESGRDVHDMPDNRQLQIRHLQAVQSHRPLAYIRLRDTIAGYWPRTRHVPNTRQHHYSLKGSTSRTFAARTTKLGLW